MKYLVTGDTHGRVIDRIARIDRERYIPAESALIILGDAGINFYLNKTDKKNKEAINNTGYTIYCVRGNHEERPENIPSMEQRYDTDIDGCVWLEPQYPNIKYLMDGHIYTFNGHTALVIGGAYSVDKWYRLGRFPAGSKWTGWFPEEQLTQKEMEDISKWFSDRHYDFVFSHTCPYSWQPIDLFLPSLDQSSVDKTMEFWLDDFKNNITWGMWLFGHFHSDRVIQPRVKMFYTDIEDLEILSKGE